MKNETHNFRKLHINSKIEKSKSNTNCNVYLDELVRIYNEEKSLNATLPTKIKNENNQEIIEALTTHLIFTQEHLLRLEDFFESINYKINN
ncbi:DUF892 family protein [Flavobacterium sp.]|uniref:DUF892 family protein n=1 Tax=Flavobacterium sp. TaxID=239 RepID=UPI00375132E7